MSSHISKFANLINGLRAEVTKNANPK